LVMPGSRGSAGTPAGVAESIRRGTGPAAVLLGTADVNIAIGAMVADRLYGSAVPVLAVAPEDYPRLRSGDEIAIAVDGTVTIAAGAGPRSGGSARAALGEDSLQVTAVHVQPPRCLRDVAVADF
ncbi:MAG: DUF126 domain-containing protein, partial [Limibaculum sp.]